jgi:outer membrane protein assembly factor BamD (BamD/ComL family)
MRLRLLFCLIILSFSSCKTEQDKALEKVMSLEMELKALEDASTNMELASEVVFAYQEFVKAYPEAVENPGLLYKCGEVYKGMGKDLMSAKVFFQVQSNYPNTKYAPMALFLQGHAFEAIGQRLTAKTIYEEFLERYPEHPYSEQVMGMIALLQYSDEELIEQFQK